MIIDAAVDAVFGGGERGWRSGVGFAAGDSIASVEIVGRWEGEGCIVVGAAKGSHCCYIILL